MSIKRQHSTATHVAIPLRQWWQRGSLLLLVTSAAAMLILSKSQNSFVTHARMQVADALAPVLAVAASPVQAAADAAAWLSEMQQMRTEVVALRNENIALKRRETQAVELETENRALRSLLGVVTPGKASYVTARVVGDGGGPFVHSLLLNAGSASGVRIDQAVVTGQGLAGRIVEAGESTARVLLVTDINSRVPVMGEISRERGIAAGDNSGTLTMHYVGSRSRLQPGEKLVTTGDGGVFPSGLAVGVVSEIGPASVTLLPLADRAQLDYVSVVDYRF